MSGKPGEGEVEVEASDQNTDESGMTVARPVAAEPQTPDLPVEALPESPITSERLIGRFFGDDGRRRLRGQLLDNSLLRGDASVADALLAVLVLQEAAPGQAVINQGSPDNDLYLVISGNLSVKVNGREVAQRSSGSHFGEMSLVDAVALRAATVTAIDYAVLARIPEGDFEQIAAAHPDLWRRLAIEISRRLQERSRLLRPPRERPVVFLGCSTESLAIAQEIQLCMEHDRCLVDIWTDGVFRPSGTPIEDLERKVREIDFGIMLVTPDDQVEARGERVFSPRDNVIFELGLLIGALGRDRVLLVLPRNVDIRIPSDLSGVTPITYATDGVPLRAALGPVCTQLREVFSRLGPI